MPPIDQDQLFQYQIKTEAPFAFISRDIPQFESTFHQAWSEPVRFLVVPRLRVALIVSGPFAPVLTDNQLTGTLESRWHQPWSEPVRLPLRLRTGIQQDKTTFFDILPKPGNQIQGWYQFLREPVWPKKGLRPSLQLPHTEPVRYLPPAQVTVVISATETNTDAMEMDVSVYDEITPTPEAIASANVAITEVPVDTEANVSFREREPE